MAPEKVTTMILDVDLKCCSCYKKVKKVLCKFPQIRDQVFDEDKNKVTITVICCNPEKMRDQLCCKGRKTIQRIEIVEDKPKPEKPPKDPPKDPPPKKPDPPPCSRVPVRTCCRECFEGRDGGPCHYGYGRLVPPPPGPCYDGYGYGYGYSYQYGVNRPCYVSRCEYFSEENPQGCSIL